MHEPKVVPTKAFNDTLIRSFFLSGAIALIPETRIPTEEKLAKPHKAYRVISLDLSDKTSGSKFARAPYATNSLRAVFRPNNSAEAKVSERGTPISQTIGKKI